ncbi:MAG: hypothetical protein J3Q66DRAFT_416868 [Benniella sp.]|nr:MAG: hypothetical protein J3Q66DRAFT_416868 [Benniella sp.]
MMLSLKIVALTALATAAVAAPIKRDDQVAACFNGLVLTGTWPDSCQAAVANPGIIQSIALNQLSMDFTGATAAWAPVTSSNEVVATLVTIPGVSLPIQSVRQHIVLADGANDLGSIEADWAPASVSGSTLTTSLPASPLNVNANAHSEFSSFIGAISSQASHPVTLKGTVDAVFNLGSFGQKTINGIAFNNNVVLDGLNNLDITYKTGAYIDLVGAGDVVAGSVLSIVNPSKLTLKLGDVSLDTTTAAGHVGYSTIKDLTLVPGENIVIASTSFDGSLPATNALFNDLSVGDQTLHFTGHAQSSANPALNGGLAALDSKAVVLQGFGGPTSQVPHKDWSLKVLPTTGSDRKVEIKATFQSPYYGLPVKYVSTDAASLASSGAPLFTFDDSLHFEVDSASTTVTFTAELVLELTAANKPKYQQWVNDANANGGKLPLELVWVPNVIVGNDGAAHPVDWGTDFSGDITVGSDFASILDFFP